MSKILLGFLILIFLLVSPAQALAATLSLSPSSGIVNRSCNFTLNIELDTTGAQTDGTDAILKYDPTRLSAQKIESGTIYADYPGSNIDPQSGKITVSGLAQVAQPFSGKGTLATIHFTIPPNTPTGLTQIKFDFDPNDKTKTTDSNVVERTTIVDVLSSVTDGQYTIGTGSCEGQTIKPGPPKGGPIIATPSAQPSPKPILPPAGTESLTFTIAILGVVLTILGILGLVLL